MEYELLDTGIFNEENILMYSLEYAKNDAEDHPDYASRD